MVSVADKIVEAFETWDVEGRGIISSSQLVRILKQLTPCITDNDIGVLLKEAHPLSSTEVNYKDFIRWLCDDCSFDEREHMQESFRESGLWEGTLQASRMRCASSWPVERVNWYFDQVYSRLASEDYVQHVKRDLFTRTDQDKDGLISFDEARTLICKTLQCAADIEHTHQPTQEQIREAFDAHDTIAFGRGRMGEQEFLNLARYLQVRVAEAMLPFSKVITDG